MKVVTAPPARLAAEQLATMARNGLAGAGSGLLGAVALGVMLVWIERARAADVSIWLVLLCVIYGLHVALCISWRRQAPPSEAALAWCRGFMWVGLVEGLFWGFGIVWFCATGSLEQELLVLLIGGGIAGAVGLSFGSYLPAYFARFVPATVPYVVWAAALAPGHSAMHELLALVVFLFIPGNVQLARLFNTSFIEVQQARFRNIDLAAELRVQKEAAEAATLAKSRFLAAASHDLRQPVHALSLFVGALHGADLPADAQRLLEHIESSVASVDGLFAALLDISRLDAGAVQVQPSVFAIHPLLERICRDHAADAAQKNLQLRLHPCSAFVFTDRLLLERVLRNLIANAIRYTDHGRVVVGCRPGATLAVQVWDTGRGIAPEQQSRVFEEFFQLHAPDAERGQGLGLGLAIVRRLSELLGVQLSLCSRLGRGSCFSLALPVADVPSPDIVADDMQAGRGSGLILVVDDNAGIREAMGALLRRWGYEPIVAASGQELLARELPMPDVIICDYYLEHGQNGLELVAALRERFSAEVPAMLITADTVLEVEGMLVLRKPVPNGRLRAAVGRLMGSKSAGKRQEGLLF